MQPGSVEETFEGGNVGAGPIDLPALFTSREFVKLLSGPWRQLVQHVGLGRRREGAIAIDAPGHWCSVVQQVEAVKHLQRLHFGLVGSRAVAMHDDPAHQQAAIAGQQDSILIDGDSCELPVARVGLVPAVETEQSQTSSQRPQMDVEHETGFDCLGSDGNHRTRIEVPKRRVHGNEFATGEQMIEVDGLSIDDDQRNFWMGNTQ